MVHEVDAGRLGLLRRQRRRGQHRRDREVPERRGAGVAVDRRRRVPRRDVPFAVTQHAVHLPRARHRRRRLAGGPRQRRARRHGRGEARQHRLHDPRPARPRRPGRQQGRRRHRQPGPPTTPRRWRPRFESAWWFGQDTDQYADSIDDPATRQRQHEDLPAALDRRHPDGGRAGPPGPGRPARWPPTSTARRRSAQREEPCYSGEFGLFHTGTGPTSDRRRQQGRDLRQLGVHGAERAVDLHAEHLDHGGRRGQLRPAGRRPAAALHHRQRPDPARPDRVGDARRDAGDRSVARTSGRTSAGRSTSGRWRCRPGAPTASCGRSCTSSSASAPTSVAAGSRSCRRSPEGQHRVAGSNIRLGDGSVDVAAERTTSSADDDGDPARQHAPAHRPRAAHRCGGRDR